MQYDTLEENSSLGYHNPNDTSLYCIVFSVIKIVETTTEALW